MVKDEINVKDEIDCVIFGGIVMDHYYKINNWPERGQDGFISSESDKVGGCAINMAVTIRNLGASSAVISGIGRDEPGRQIADYMIDNDLSTELLYPIDEDSGKCLVFLDKDGERTFLTKKGAEGSFTKAMAEAALRANPKVLGVTGYYLLDKDNERVINCLEILSRRGAKILFDPGPLVGKIPFGILGRILMISDVITPNKEEAEVIEESISLKALAKGKRTIIEKYGKDGGRIIYSDWKHMPNGNNFNLEAPDIIEEEYEAIKCYAVDTTGAGDSFSGALLYGMLNNLPITESVKLAVRCAAQTVIIEGPHGYWHLEEN